MAEAVMFLSWFVEEELGLIAQLFLHNDHRNTIRTNFTIDDQHLAHIGTHIIELPHVFCFKGQDILIDASEAFIQIFDKLLRTHDPNDLSRTRGIWPELAT